MRIDPVQSVNSSEVFVVDHLQVSDMAKSIYYRLQYILLVLLVWRSTVGARNIQTHSNEHTDNDRMHPSLAEGISTGRAQRIPDYLSLGQQFVGQQIKRQQNNNAAKNVILFLGDGMSMATLAATRMYMNNGNENETLSFERFPHSAMSKTYCVNAQVADSACTSTG